MRPCPHCTKEIKDNAEICKWCLRSVGPETEGPQVTNDTVRSSPFLPPARLAEQPETTANLSCIQYP